jgi:hypothetical protein
VRQGVAVFLHLLDLRAHVPGRRVRSEHLLEQGGAGDDAVSEGGEIVEELLFARDEAECGHGVLRGWQRGPRHAAAAPSRRGNYVIDVLRGRYKRMIADF